MWRVIGIVLAVVGLAGCSGIEPGKTYPHETFTTSITYQEAYRRAQAYAHTCLSTFDTTGDLYTDNRTGVVRVSIPKFLYTGKESLRADIAAKGDDQTQVIVTVDGVGVFDMAQIAAAKESIESGKPTCK
jgi:hypothetical protein